MSPTALLAVGLLLLGGILCGVLAFILGGSSEKLRTRVKAAGGTAVVTAGGGAASGGAGGLPSIRVQVRTSQPWLVSVQRFLRYYPDVPAAYSFPWWAVVAVGGVIGLALALRLEILLGAPAALAAGLGGGLMLIRTVFGSQFNSYKEKAFQQIPDALGQMVRTVRAGLPMSEALRSVSREMPSPTAEEFARVVGDIAIGRPVDHALLRLAERTQLTEYAFLAVTLGVQS